MARKKLEGKKLQIHGGTAGPGNQWKTPLAKDIARNLAKKGPAPLGPNQQIAKDREEKERGSAIAVWKCFYLDNILVKWIYKEEEEGVHDE